MGRKKQWTAEQWETSRDILRMIVGMEDHARKLRLFGCGWFRSKWVGISNEFALRAVEAAEKYADGLISLEEMRAARDAAVGKDFSGAFVVADPHPRNAGLAALHGYRRNTKARTAQLLMLREVFGNPFRPLQADPALLAWNDGAVRKLAQVIYDERRFQDLPLLADALEDAGCVNADILAHCRSGTEHARGCFALDLLLGKN